MKLYVQVIIHSEQNLKRLKLKPSNIQFILFSFVCDSSDTTSLVRILPSGVLSLRINLNYGSYGQLVRAISTPQGRYLRWTTQTEEKRTYIHASSGIRIHDPTV
jgi:hypothetical protein